MHRLPVTNRTGALSIGRGVVFNRPSRVSAGELALIRRLDTLHLDFRFASARMLRRFVRRDFPRVGRRRIGTLLRRTWLAADRPQPCTGRQHRAYLVLLLLRRHCSITWPYEVCAMGTSYIPIAYSSAYLATVLN